MINLNRPQEAPLSLSRNVVLAHLGALTRFLVNAELNSDPGSGPEVRNEDILEIFQTHFFSKCYLTEEKFPSVYRLEIDHFKPENQYRLLKYDWHNLFPISHWANQQRPKKYPEGGLLNPSAAEDNVENEIVYDADLVGGFLFFHAADRSNRKAINTAELLDRLHNGFDAKSRRATAGLRGLIEKRMSEVEKEILRWKRFPTGSEESQECENNLRDFLSRSSSFTMLMRSCSLVREEVPLAFLD